MQNPPHYPPRHATHAQIQELAHISATRGLFGGAPTVERCLQELSSYSDHQIHGFALTHHKLLEKYILPQDSILASAKVGRGGRAAPHRPMRWVLCCKRLLLAKGEGAGRTDRRRMGKGGRSEGAEAPD